MNLGINIHLRTLAASQYSGWDFTSMVEFNGQVVAFGPAGVCELGGETDQGTQIDALVDLPTTDFGLFEDKRLESVRLGGQSFGSLKLTFTADETASREQSVTLGAVRLNEAEHTRTAILRRVRGAVGASWRVRVENVIGGDFSLDGLQLLVAVLKRRSW
jgi:hypothetical protein